ncbi:MAG: hypothetical protein AAF431_03645 [Pseudomonadota bacterium]
MSSSDHREPRKFRLGDLMYGRSDIRTETAMFMTAGASLGVDEHNAKVDQRAQKIAVHARDAAAIAESRSGKVLAPPKVKHLPTQKRTFVSTLDAYGSKFMFKGMSSHRTETGLDDLALTDSQDFMRQNHAHPKYRRYTDALSAQIVADGGKRYASTEDRWRRAGTTTKVKDNSVFRAKSKFGLQWALERGKHIHFAVSETGMNMHQVATKNEPGDYKNNAQDKIRSFTGSELRWLHRHRNDPLVQSNVHFVAKDEHTGGKIQAVPAPWNDTVRQSAHHETGAPIKWNEAWKDYHSSREEPARLTPRVV